MRLFLVESRPLDQSRIARLGVYFGEVEAGAVSHRNDRSALFESSFPSTSLPIIAMGFLKATALALLPLLACQAAAQVDVSNITP